MPNPSIVLSILFVFFHLAIVARFVPLSTVVPAGLDASSILSMALALIFLAARWHAVDHLISGPGRSYHLHHWLGFFALAGAIGHWMIASRTHLENASEGRNRPTHLPSETRGAAVQIALTAIAAR